uniref:Putative WRKY75 protein n=1 Tax=Fagopyrum hailuogouense TaxID=1208415 RepID=A0A7T3UYX2_9CARY|nr:putative WRKY75 protein [Fagopyrum hailuogouense]
MDKYEFLYPNPSTSTSTNSPVHSNDQYLPCSFQHQHQHQHQSSTSISHLDNKGAGAGAVEAMDLKSGGTNKRLNKGSCRKHRYAFQTRTQVDILDDGYRWRKYGQKAVKNNKFPRSYYRCTHQGCSVKKQVQRLSKDEDVVVTTYEGIHSHPIDKSTDNFEHILTQMQIYAAF